MKIKNIYKYVKKVNTERGNIQILKQIRSKKSENETCKGTKKQAMVQLY